MAEIVSAFDVNQFGVGQSQYKCGPYAVYLCSAFGPPGQPPLYNPSWVASMADTWYEKNIGPNTTADQVGVTNDQLYQCIRDSGHAYQVIKQSDIPAAIGGGCPVIIGISENSVHDMGAGRNPYGWNTAGLFHIISITGMLAGHYLVRDTANNLPGPRMYDASKLILTSATVFFPSWYKQQSQVTSTADSTLWRSYNPNIPLNPGSAIYKSWVAMRVNGKEPGPPVTSEFSEQGRTKQQFTASLAMWDGKNVIWYDARGPIRNLIES